MKKFLMVFILALAVFTVSCDITSSTTDEEFLANAAELSGTTFTFNDGSTAQFSSSGSTIYLSGSGTSGSLSFVSALSSSSATYVNQNGVNFTVTISGNSVTFYQQS